MRNKRTVIGIVAVLVAALTASIAWAAPGDTIQTVKGAISPSKLPKKKFKNSAINVQTSTGVEGEDGMADPALRPPPAERALLTFDKDVKFDTKGVAKCTANLNGTSTAAAKDACGSSVVGGGAAEIAIGSGANRFDAVVTAFNGPTQNGNPSLLLHSRVDDLGTTAILIGELKKAGKVYKLDVAIPQIANGQGSVTKFQTKVKDGKYVQAKCPDKKFDIKGTFFYDDDTQETAKSSSTCKGTGRR